MQRFTKAAVAALALVALGAGPACSSASKEDIKKTVSDVGSDVKSVASNVSESVASFNSSAN